MELLDRKFLLRVGMLALNSNAGGSEQAVAEARDGCAMQPSLAG